MLGSLTIKADSRNFITIDSCLKTCTIVNIELLFFFSYLSISCPVAVCQLIINMMMMMMMMMMILHALTVKILTPPLNSATLISYKTGLFL